MILKIKYLEYLIRREIRVKHDPTEFPERFGIKHPFPVFRADGWSHNTGVWRSRTTGKAERLTFEVEWM